jgi:hypothetical protein
MIILRGIEGGDVDDDAVTPVGGQYPLEGVVDPVGRDRFDLGAQPCSAQKSSISPVSVMPPIMDPVIERPLVSSEKAFSDKGFAGAPTLTSTPSAPSSPR